MPFAELLLQIGLGGRHFQIVYMQMQVHMCLEGNAVSI